METSQITPSTIRPCLFPSSVTKPRTKICFPPGKPKKITVLASKDNDDNKLNQWDLMELKFGQMLGEDPKLTLAKIKGRKANPDASYLEIEKNFHKNKGEIVEVKEVPFDVPRKGKSANGLNLVRPVPKGGMKVGNDNDVIPASVKKSGESVESKSQSSTKSIVPNVILRKPSMFIENGDETGTSLRMKIKPNLSLKMRTEPVKEKFSGMTLLKKPEPISLNENVDKKQDSSSNVEIKVADGVEENNLMNSTMPTGVADAKSNIYDEYSESQVKQASQSSSKVTMLEKPKPIYNKNAIENNSGHAPESSGTSVMENCLGGFSESNDYLSSIHQKIEQSSEVVEQTDTVSSEKENEVSNPPALEVVSSDYSAEAALQGKPRRLDQSVKAVTNPSGLRTVSTLPESLGGDGEIESSFSSSPLMELEDTDWARAEMLVKSGDRKEVEIISCSTRGFAVSFGSLIGFLPYRNLAAKWKFLAFESWLRKKGLDPSKYRQKLGIIGSYEVPYKNASHQSQLNPENSQSTVVEVTADMEVEDLFRIYEQEKIRFLSSFVGQRIKVNILLADKKSRKLIFSTRQKEKDETVEKKRNLMAKLSIGDVVKCSIKKITFFGIFVEVEGVPALIHQTEISWDVTVNPASFFKIGQIVEAKVHQLDFALDRIFLSLKELTPDPLIGALECIVGHHNALNGTLEASQTDYEWADVDSLIKELQEIEGVHNVSKGRFFLSPGLAPTFQVYMASTFENQYKLLARSGNKVQEVMVQASLDKEEMKSAIMTCTNRVQ